MKRFAIFALLLTLAPLSAAGRSDRDPVSAAMAGAGLSGALAPAWGAFSNPAAIVFSPEDFSASASWQNWMPRYGGGQAFSLGAAYGRGRTGASVAVSGLTGKAYEIVSSSGGASGTFVPVELDLAAGFGAEIADGWTLSAAVRFLHGRLAADYDYQLIGATLLAGWRQERFSLTGGIADLGSKADGHALLPAAAVLSAAWTPAAAGAHGFLAALDAKCYLSGGFGAALGLQYAYDGHFFARAGYRFSTAAIDLPSHAAAGIGVRFGGVSLDLSCLFASPTLAGTVLVGIGYGF